MTCSSRAGPGELKEGKTLGEKLSPVTQGRKGKIDEAVIGDEPDPLPGNKGDDRLEQQIIGPAGEAFRSSFILVMNGAEKGKDETSEFLPRESDPLQMDHIPVNGPDIEARFGHEVVEKGGIPIESRWSEEASIPWTETRERSFLSSAPRRPISSRYSSSALLSRSEKLPGLRFSGNLQDPPLENPDRLAELPFPSEQLPFRRAPADILSGQKIHDHERLCLLRRRQGFAGAPLSGEQLNEQFIDDPALTPADLRKHLRCPVRIAGSKRIASASCRAVIASPIRPGLAVIAGQQEPRPDPIGRRAVPVGPFPEPFRPPGALRRRFPRQYRVPRETGGSRSRPHGNPPGATASAA